MKAILQPTYSGELPIHQRREEIVAAIKAHQVVVIAGETGSGKTTQIPKFLLDCGLGQHGLLGCTQPRRVAALSVAERIAEELGVRYGHEVGTKIRFTDQTKPHTVLKVMTDGILLNELQDDPDLKAYEAIVIDEAHERSLNIDFILGCLRQLTRRRKDLKIIITSATIDTASFAKAFDDAPIIEVSGRTFPVELHYRAPEEMLEVEEGDYIEAAAATVHEIVAGNREGDLLVFLPGERDIHELRRKLEDGPARGCDLLPLYGRLANADQQRIFHPGGRRRIILSTNIAETSLTVPGIRYVIDTGMARLSRYSPHSRTQRLPIEAIAQSSADQRKGRCGRVSNGICYRLYSEQDFLSRPRFTTPEIHRSNLASVILRMMAFRLGDIRNFPFIDPPAENAIVGGYRLLAELGAVSSDERSPDPEAYRLTKLGRQLARIPADPTVARMLLEAQKEDVLSEVLIIAAGLSIQDPRERPAELAKEADEMHKQFTHPESDFLTLLNIWNSYHDKLDTLSQNKLRKFCKRHYLAYQRMREWRDIHHQLERILKNLKLGKSKQAPTQTAKRNTPDTSLTNYAAVHRSILSGLLSNIAHKEQEHNYRGPRNRKALLFPGSGLFDHETAKKQRKASYAKTAKPKPAKTTAPQWIVCGEWMETSRLFARTAAKIEVQWIEAIAGDLLQIRHTEPFWSSKAAAALCKERKLLFGLEIARGNVSYSRIDPAEATEIFIRNGLIEGGIKERPKFFQHNEKLQAQAESELARRRSGSAFQIEDNLFGFYHQRLQSVGSFAELRKFAKEKHGGSLDFLKASEADLLPPAPGTVPTDAYPRSLQLGGSEIPLQYRNEPGTEEDGVTLRVPLSQIGVIQQGTLDWAVPGHLAEKIEHLLRALPKPIRVKLHPLKERAAELRDQLQPSERPLSEQLAEQLRKAYGIETYKDQWQAATLPSHLQPRIQIENTKGESLAQSRSLDHLRSELEQKSKQAASGNNLEAVPAWQQAAAQHERENLNGWDFGDLPESIDLSGDSGLPLKAYPALVEDQQSIHLRLLPNREAALAATRSGWVALGEQSLARDLAWLRRDLKELKRLGTLLLQVDGYEAIKDSAWAHIRRHLFQTDHLLPLKQSVFEKTRQRADQARKGIVLQLHDRLKALLEAREAIVLLLEQKKTAQAISYPGMRAQLEAIAPAQLLEAYEFDDLPHLTRYLKAMQLRAKRAKESIQKDIDKTKRIAPYQTKLENLQKLAQKAKQPTATKPYTILLEEFKVSIYAQELGTAQKVSEKRLDQLASQISEQLKR